MQGHVWGSRTMTSNVATALGTAAILLLQAIIIGGSLYIVFHVARRRSAGGKQEQIRTGKDGGTVIPIIAAFAGVRGLPRWFALAFNNANPSLVIVASGIRYRLIRTYERRFEDIARTGSGLPGRRLNIEMQFQGELLTFTVNVGTTAAAGAALALFPPEVDMSDGAKAIVSSSISKQTDQRCLRRREAEAATQL